jgi:hypothetical protein
MHLPGEAGGKGSQQPRLHHAATTNHNQCSRSGDRSIFHADATCRFCWKHSRQNTGRPCVGRNGTVVSLAHCEHTVRVSTFGAPWPVCVIAPNTETRLVLQVLQRFGSFLNCLSWKNNCSPAVKMKSAPQSIHRKILSWNSIGNYSLQRDSLAHAEPQRARIAVPLVRKCALVH